MNQIKTEHIIDMKNCAIMTVHHRKESLSIPKHLLTKENAVVFFSSSVHKHNRGTADLAWHTAGARPDSQCCLHNGYQ